MSSLNGPCSFGKRMVHEITRIKHEQNVPDSELDRTRQAKVSPLNLIPVVRYLQAPLNFQFVGAALRGGPLFPIH